MQIIFKKRRGGLSWKWGIELKGLEKLHFYSSYKPVYTYIDNQECFFRK